MAGLVNDVLSYWEKATDPRDWETVVEALTATNAPRQLTDHTKRWKWMYSTKDTDGVDHTALQVGRFCTFWFLASRPYSDSPLTHPCFSGKVGHR